VRTKLHMPPRAKGKRNDHDDDDKRWPICEGWIKENTKFRRRHLAWRIEVLCASRTCRLNCCCYFGRILFLPRPGRVASCRPARAGPARLRLAVYLPLPWHCPTDFLPASPSIISVRPRWSACHDVRFDCGMPCVPRGSITDRLASRPALGPPSIGSA